MSHWYNYTGVKRKANLEGVSSPSLSYTSPSLSFDHMPCTRTSSVPFPQHGCFLNIQGRKQQAISITPKWDRSLIVFFGSKYANFIHESTGVDTFFFNHQRPFVEQRVGMKNYDDENVINPKKCGFIYLGNELALKVNFLKKTAKYILQCAFNSSENKVAISRHSYSIKHDYSVHRVVKITV